jgi:hypothetical protein
MKFGGPLRCVSLEIALRHLATGRTRQFINDDEMFGPPLA